MHMDAGHSVSSVQYDSLTPSPSPNIVGQHGAITDRYQDYNRAQMLSALVQLEMVR